MDYINISHDIPNTSLVFCGKMAIKKKNKIIKRDKNLRNLEFVGVIILLILILVAWQVSTAQNFGFYLLIAFDCAVFSFSFIEQNLTNNDKDEEKLLFGNLITVTTFLFVVVTSYVGFGLSPLCSSGSLHLCVSANVLNAWFTALLLIIFLSSICISMIIRLKRIRWLSYFLVLLTLFSQIAIIAYLLKFLVVHS